MRFKEQRSYRSIKKQGGSASADEQAAANFLKAFTKIIEKNGFLPEQIFNIDKTRLYWIWTQMVSAFQKLWMLVMNLLLLII